MQSSYPYAQLPTSCFHTNMRNNQFRLQSSYHKRIYQFYVKSSYPHAQFTNFRYNFDIHMYPYRFRSYSSYPQDQSPIPGTYLHAPLPILCTIFIHQAPLPILGTIFIPTSTVSLHSSHTIFIPTCGITDCVHNPHIHVRNYY